MSRRAVRIIGPGRAGQAMAHALEEAGWDLAPLLGRASSVARAASGVDLVIIATPDAAVPEVAAAIDPGPAVVAHLSGSLGLDVLDPHERRCSIHPLAALPNADIGARRLRGAWFAVAGAHIGREVADALGGRWFEVDDAHRAAYHAAACIASNHLVALLGQAERIAASASVPFEALLDLVRATVDNVAELGPAEALTGPVARGDWATVRRHLAALAPDERPAYDLLAHHAQRLVSEP